MIQFRPWIRWIERRACRTKDTGCGTKMIPRRRRKPESKNNTERNDLVWLSVSAVIVRRGKNTQGQSDCVRRKADWRNLSSRLTFYDRILSHNQLTVTIELGVDLYRHTSDTLKNFRLELRIETDWVADSVGLLGKKCRECWMNLSSRTLRCAWNKWTEQRHPLESISDTFTVDSATARTNYGCRFALCG